MSAANKHTETFCKGTFTGIFQPVNKQANGYFMVGNLHCNYFRVDQFSEVIDVNLESIKTGDFWFIPLMRSGDGFSSNKLTEIFIAVGDAQFYSGDLQNVLIKNLKFSYGGSKTQSPIKQEWLEVSGDVWFQLTTERKKTTDQPLAATHTSSTKGVTIFTEENVLHRTTTEYDTDYNTEKTSMPEPVSHVNQSVPIIQKPAAWLSGFGWLTLFIAAALIGYYLWQISPVWGALFGITILLFAIGKMFLKNVLFRNVISVILAGFIIWFLYSIIYRDGRKGTPVKTGTGTVKIDPPKKEEDEMQKRTDYTTGKQIDWYDFENRFYSAKYKTSQIAFESSVNEQDKLINNVSRANSIAYFGQFYEGLFRMDKEKIQQVATIFRDSARMKNMNQLEVAEMVVTFIQEIPYYLVHEGNCEVAVASGNKFLQEYHAEHKPCLPDIQGGVQSPYEFLHNLKGDCDTRSLLGYALLYELKIPASVWISEVYGHSILGVGLPMGHGFYKNVGGFKHYGVELTAKGFRIGMVAPENAQPLNWDIAIYTNQF